MNIFTICGLLIITVFLVLIIKPERPELALALSALCGITVIGLLLIQVLPALKSIDALIEQASMGGEYIYLLFKGLGICLLTQFCADTCRDAGENGLANKTELAGKICLLIIAIPLFEKIGETVVNLINNA